MTKHYIVEHNELIAELDDTQRDQRIDYDCKILEWLWDYLKPQPSVSEDEDEPNDEWIPVDRFNMLPSGHKHRVRAVNYKNGDHFGRDRIGNSVVNPDDKDIAELFQDLLHTYEKWVGDDFAIYSENDFTSGEWMGDPADWKSQGYRERINITNGTYEFEEYEETEDAD